MRNNHPKIAILCAIMLLELSITCGLIALVYCVYKYECMSSKISTTIIFMPIYDILQVRLCSLPSAEELWHQRPNTSAFLWESWGTKKKWYRITGIVI